MRFVPGNSRTSSQVVLSPERALLGDSKELLRLLVIGFFCFKRAGGKPDRRRSDDKRQRQGW
jgi:hypothetical protein